MRVFPSIFLAILLLAITHGVAQSEEEESIWHILAKRPDATIALKKDSEGQIRRVATLKSGVSFSEVEDGIVSIDNSGKGAVLCIWEIFSDAASTLKICGAKENEDIQKAFDHAVDDINVFIVANSLTAVTKEELEAAIAKRHTVYQENMAKFSKQKFEKECLSGMAAHMAKEYKSMWGSKASDQIKNMTREMLSVPRPPVTNPCL